MFFSRKVLTSINVHTENFPVDLTRFFSFQTIFIRQNLNQITSIEAKSSQTANLNYKTAISGERERE